MVKLSKTQNTVNSIDKLQLFLKNAEFLREILKIEPLLYGSLGLEYLTGENLKADDIDILIPQVFLLEKWDSFKCLLEDNGYILIDEHEHTFEKDNVHYSYASIEELKDFADISVENIRTVTEGNVSFKLLTLQQYLKVYTASSKDGYRKNVKNKKDSEKIGLINKHLKAVTSKNTSVNIEEKNK